MGYGRDEVHALVVDRPPSLRETRLLLMLRAYFDDSDMSQREFAVLAGWVKEAGVWEQFADDWDAVLRMSPRIEYFKWSEFRGRNGQFAGISDERACEKIRLLAGVIADRNPLGVASIIPRDIHQRIFSQNPDSSMRNPYFLSFYSVVVQLVEFLDSHGIRDKVDFIFDIQPGQSENALASWEHLRRIAPASIHQTIGSVSFRDDHHELPLQAADLSAGFLREQARTSLLGEPSDVPPWGDGRTDHVSLLSRLWTEDLYAELARRTGAFKMPG